MNIEDFNLEKNSWIKTCKRFFTYLDEGGNKYLVSYLYDNEKYLVLNKIRLHPLLHNIFNLDNENGYLKYNMSENDDKIIMSKLFTEYKGKTKKRINIKECIMLSVNNKKYNKLREDTLNILKEYNLPKISTFFGFNSDTLTKSKFYICIVYENKNKRHELVCGMLEIFDKFLNESQGNEWLLYFQDDVRPVNVSKSENLNYLYNIPEDAELIRPYIGKNTPCKLKNIKYLESYGGAANHAFYISTEGCRKVLNYAKKYGWKFEDDVDLYKISKFNIDVPSGYDAWSLKYTNGQCDSVSVDSDDEKLAIYQMDNIIFNQTSMPCASFI